MKDIFMWLTIIGLGGFFFWLLVYSFYMVIFSKNDKTSSKETKTKTLPVNIKGKFVGRT